MSDQYQVNPEWLKYTHKDESYLFSQINDNYGIHAEGQSSLLPFQSVECIELTLESTEDTRLQAIADACRITTDMFYEWRRNDDHTDKKWVWRQIRDLLALAEGEMTAEQFMEAYNSAEFIGDDPWSAYSRDERGMDALTEETDDV